MELNIVLVEPQIPQNTGNIARTCAVTGARLHLIRPMGFTPDDKQLKRAGLDYWHYLDITYYDGLDDFFSKNDGAYFYFSTKAVNTYSDVSYPDKCFLFFGREDAGLPEKLLFENKESCVRIPMRETLRSLNHGQRLRYLKGKRGKVQGSARDNALHGDYPGQELR